MNVEDPTDMDWEQHKEFEHCQIHPIENTNPLSFKSFCFHIYNCDSGVLNFSQITSKEQNVISEETL